MTDKQIKLDGSWIPMEVAIKAGLISEKDINVPSKNNKYRLGQTKIERQQIFEDIKEMIENGFSLQNIADKYGVTRQAISLKMKNCGFYVSQEVKRIKREKIKKLLEETAINNVEKLNRKVKYYKTYNIRLRNDLTELKEQLKYLEKACEYREETYLTNLTNLVNETDFLRKKLHEKEQECELWKMRYEELKKQSGRFEAHLATLEAKIEVGKAQYKELQSKNEELKKYKDLAEHNGRVCNERLDKIDELEHDINELNEQLYQLKATNEDLLSIQYKLADNNKQLRQTLTEIKEIAKSTSSFKSIFEEPFVEVMKHCPYLNDNVFCTENKTSCVGCICARKQAVYYGEKVAYLEPILQKISEVEDGRQ